jgi:peroxiredoxin
MERVQREYRGRLRVVAVNIQEPRDVVAAWTRAQNVSFTVLLDADGAVTRRYEVTGTPTVFVVDRAGRLRGKAIGTKDWMGPAGRALLDKLVRS